MVTLLYNIYNMLGMPEDVAWSTAVSLCIYDVKSLIRLYDVLYSEKKWVPVFALDEVGVLISKYWHWNPDKRAKKLQMIVQELTHLVKDISIATFYAAPLKDAMAKMLRDMCDIKIEGRSIRFGSYEIVEWLHEVRTTYTVTVYTHSREKFIATLPKSKEVIVLREVTPHPLRLPREVWETLKYVRRFDLVKSRIAYAKKLLEEIEKGEESEEVEEVEREVPRRRRSVATEVEFDEEEIP